MTALRLGTRGSQLAVRQAHLVAESLARAGGPACEIVVIKTSGDQQATRTLSELGGKRLYVRELEEALVGRVIDLAVHSLKDLPVDLPDELSVPAVLERADPSDALILPERLHSTRLSFEELQSAVGPSPSIGTSSVRRVAQLARVWEGARFTPIRGNLDTRLRKLDRGEYDLLVLASAGLSRLGLADRITCTLPVTICVPAAGQGTIATEARAADERVCQALATITDSLTMASAQAERALVKALGGGCQTPIGAIATPDGEQLDLLAVVASLDGRRLVRGQARGRIESPGNLGSSLASRLIADGALEILNEGHR